MEAMSIAGPKESIGSACSRPDMPPTIEAAIRALLLSTADVPGTEGRKRKLRFDGHANNVVWGPPSFFVTPNFADSNSQLVKMLHAGPSRDSHMNIQAGASRPAAAGASQPAARAGSFGDPAPEPLRGYLASTEPLTPSLIRVHEIVAADLRAQAKFFLLMSE